MRPLAGGGKYQVSSGAGGAGGWPVSARSGRELFYQQQNKVVAVSVRTAPSFSAGEPRVLFEGPYLAGDWDVAADGRFIMVKPGEAELAPRSLQVVLNWFEELKRLAPVGR